MKEFRQVVLAPVLVVGMAALLLYGLDMLPAYLPGFAPAVTEYNSVEEASSQLGFNIVVPVYFPSYLAWPPEKILGQLKPFPLVQMSFLSSDHHDEILLIYQSVSESRDLPAPLPWIETVSQQIPVTINNIQG